MSQRIMLTKDWPILKRENVKTIATTDSPNCFTPMLDGVNYDRKCFNCSKLYDQSCQNGVHAFKKERATLRRYRQFVAPLKEPDDYDFPEWRCYAEFDSNLSHIDFENYPPVDINGELITIDRLNDAEIVKSADCVKYINKEIHIRPFFYIANYHSDSNRYPMYYYYDRFVGLQDIIHAYVHMINVRSGRELPYGYRGKRGWRNSLSW